MRNFCPEDAAALVNFAIPGVDELARVLESLYRVSRLWVPRHFSMEANAKRKSGCVCVQ